jgi:hypothetical protein
MSDIEQPVVDFFLALQHNVNAGDTEAIARACGPELLVHGSSGVRTLSNDGVRAVVSDWLQVARDAGLRDAKALQIDPQSITGTAALTRVLWSIWFMPDGRSDFVLEFVYHYLLAIDAGTITIVAVLEGDGTAATWTELPRLVRGDA